MKNISTFLLLALPFFLFAQASPNFEELGRQYLQSHSESWELSASDVKDVALVNQVFTKHNRVTSLYFNQRYRGVELHNAVYNISFLPSGKILSAHQRFFNHLSERIHTVVPSVSSEDAVSLVLTHFGLAAKTKPRLIDKNGFIYRYAKGNIAAMDIQSQLNFFPQGEDLALVWEIIFAPKNDSDVWALRLDATTGKILDQKSMTVHCAFESGQYKTTSPPCPNTPAESQEMIGPDGASYRVLPYNTESPAHGNRLLLTNPAKLSASPYGWHDTNGVDGAEYTITRGNNVHAYLDLDGANESAGDEPDGGAGLSFDFPFDISQEPSNFRKAAVTNLFYMNNFMHDFSYQYGFDEDAGNFQEKNYTAPAYKGHDYVKAEAQDGSKINNSNFFTGPEGMPGKMQMYIWTGLNLHYLDVTAPNDIAGNYPTGTADFGAPISSTAETGDVVIIHDTNGSNPQYGCASTLQDLSGKIALVQRGGCAYVDKAINAQTAGAKGLIVVNSLNRVDAMTSPPGSTTAAMVHIPLVMIRNSDGAILLDKLNAGQAVSVSLQKGAGSGPDSLDGDFDNGIIAHEYAHGISTRLTGGAQNPFCFENKEQMGEGWSDFFTLAIMAKSSDDGSEVKGFGNYEKGEDAQGYGLRRFPYSTDMAINPLTYYHIMNSKIHEVGEVWTACLWDLYWLMVDKYGFDSDIYNGTGGNNKAIQLVIDGLKLQPCQPGFVDGRDAILAADQADFGGANQCLIWEAFAKRGLGLSASQGDSNNINDGKEAYDKPIACTQNLAIQKTVTPTINAGDKINVLLKITNYKGAKVTGVVVTDQIPDGTDYVAGSASMAADVQGGMISFDLGDMDDATEQTITYQLSTGSNHSASLWSDDFETDDSKWEKTSTQGNNEWDWAGSTGLGYFYSGQHSYYVPGAEGLSEQSLSMKNPVTLAATQPVLRFFQYYDTKPGDDGGILEYSTDGGLAWQDAGDFIFRHKYTGVISFNTFLTANQKAYWGKTPEQSKYVESMVDLSAFAGQDIQVRFRFATGPDPTDDMSKVWSIDDVEFMDMVNYNSEACVTSTEGDNYCAQAPAKGTVVYSDQFVGTQDVLSTNLNFGLSPNPAADMAWLYLQNTQSEQANLAIIDLAGKTIHAQSVRLSKGQQTINLNTQQLPNGMYFVRLQTPSRLGIRKMVVRH